MMIPLVIGQERSRIGNRKFYMRNKLINGEVLEVLGTVPDKIVDLGVTSPPYNKQEKNKGWLVKNVVYSEYKDKLPEDKYQEKQVEVLNEVYRVTKDGGSFFYNHKIGGKTERCFVRWIG